MTLDSPNQKDTLKEQHQLKILMLEENPKDVFLTERILQKSGFSFVIKAIKSSDEFSNILCQYQPDVILSDTATHEFGVSDIQKINRERKSTVPFILITYPGFEEKVDRFLQAGIDDILLKQNISSLPQVIRAVLTKRKKNNSIHSGNYEPASFGTPQQCGLDSLLNVVSIQMEQSLMSLGEKTRQLQLNATSAQLNHWEMVTRELSKMQSTLELVKKYNEVSIYPIQLEEIDWSIIVNTAQSEISGLEKANIRMDVAPDMAPFFSDVKYMQLFFNILFGLLSNKNLNSDITIKIKNMSGNIKLTFLNHYADQKNLPSHLPWTSEESKQEAELKLSIVREIIFRLKGIIETDMPERGQYTIIIPNNLPY